MINLVYGEAGRGIPTASRPNQSFCAAACQYTSAHGPRNADRMAGILSAGEARAGQFVINGCLARASSKAAPSFWPSSTHRPLKTSPGKARALDSAQGLLDGGLLTMLSAVHTIEQQHIAECVLQWRLHRLGSAEL